MWVVVSRVEAMHTNDDDRNQLVTSASAGRPYASGDLLEELAAREAEITTTIPAPPKDATPLQALQHTHTQLSIAREEMIADYNAAREIEEPREALQVWEEFFTRHPNIDPVATKMVTNWQTYIAGKYREWELTDLLDLGPNPGLEFWEDYWMDPTEAEELFSNPDSSTVRDMVERIHTYVIDQLVPQMLEYDPVVEATSLEEIYTFMKKAREGDLFELFPLLPEHRQAQTLHEVMDKAMWESNTAWEGVVGFLKADIYPVWVWEARERWPKTFNEELWLESLELKYLERDTDDPQILNHPAVRAERAQAAKLRRESSHQHQPD